jgi:hypothetical protein
MFHAAARRYRHLTAFIGAMQPPADCIKDQAATIRARHPDRRTGVVG